MDCKKSRDTPFFREPFGMSRPTGKRQHIELFAGCGGMALGMEKAGFDMLMANELSPMAAETFAYNILNDDLSKRPKGTTLHLCSQYPADDKRRLRENPFEAVNGKYHDLANDTDLSGKLVVGDVRQLLELFEHNTDLRNQLLGIDLLSGGPPCQGFSLAGLRIKDDYKNSLPWSFARMAGLLQPKAVLLENVKGITAPFKEDGRKFHAWREVAKAFAIEGFVPVCMMVNSKYFGVPQNRPRFVMIALREDVFLVGKQFMHQEVYSNSMSFYEVVRNVDSEKIDSTFFRYFDLESARDYPLFDGRILPKPTVTSGEWLTVKEAIGDLEKESENLRLSGVRSNFAKGLNEFFRQPGWHKAKSISNHETRNHHPSTKARFGYYQSISGLNGHTKNAEQLVKSRLTLKDAPELYRKTFEKAFDGKEVTLPDGTTNRLTCIEDFENYVLQLPQTQKHSQRALLAAEPAPAQLTIPDDLCHYEPTVLRTLTVREMARIQSFPDWFEFRSKATTGGTNRRFEVPQYTQVGNAVPPLLAYHLGVAINELLNVCPIRNNNNLVA